MKRAVYILSFLLIGSLSSSQAQGFRDAINKAKDAVKSKDSQPDKASSSSTSSKKSLKPTATFYVSTKGNNRNDGSKGAPFKDIQKAIDDAPEGALICVAEGNYLGKLNTGYISIKKYIMVEGGYSEDFSERDPFKYITSIQPTPAQTGTSGNFGLFDIYVRGNKEAVVLIDGFLLDKGQMNSYVGLNATGKFVVPEGMETGFLNAPANRINQPSMRGDRSVSNQLIHGDVEGRVIIRNCMLLNGAHFGIQMGNIGGEWEIYNNVFLANRMASCEVRGMTNTPGEAVVNFHHNTILFSWRRDWPMADKDMGYGFRYMTRVDANVYNNILGCNDFSALDRTYVDSDRTKEAVRKTSASNNLFFGNIEADITLPSTGGGKFLRIFADMFDDVDQLHVADNNREMNEEEIKIMTQVVDGPYLKNFMNMEGSTSTTHNPNSSENQFRSAMGMNLRGTESNFATMYANSYPYKKAVDLFGAIDGIGAQKFKKE